MLSATVNNYTIAFGSLISNVLVVLYEPMDAYFIFFCEDTIIFVVSILLGQPNKARPVHNSEVVYDFTKTVEWLKMSPVRDQTAYCLW